MFYWWFTFTSFQFLNRIGIFETIGLHFLAWTIFTNKAVSVLHSITLPTELLLILYHPTVFINRFNSQTTCYLVSFALITSTVNTVHINTIIFVISRRNLFVYVYCQRENRLVCLLCAKASNIYRQLLLSLNL